LSAERIVVARMPSGVRLVGGGRAACIEGLVAAERARAREQGRREGHHEALRAAAGKLEAAAERLDADRERARERLSAAAAELAIAIARELARVEVRAGRQDIERLVREVLAQSGMGRAPCQVHLNPADAQRLADVKFRAGTEIVPDVGVPRGDAQIETPQGLLVHDFDEALGRLAARLEQELA
jgi:flagellar biosynthesis/type III secretory pathway protein FliH